MNAPSTAKLLQEGLAMHRAGMRREAMDSYMQVLRADPENADALYYVAVMAMQEGQTEEGVKVAQRALSFDDKQARVHNLLGQGLHRLERRDEALAALDRAIALNGEYADAHGNRANLLAELGRHGEALLGFDRALALRPNSADDWYNRGVVLHDLGQLDEALKSYDNAIKHDERLADAHAQRGAILRELGQMDDAFGKHDSKAFDDAEASYSKAIQLDPKLIDARVGRGILRLLRGEWDGGWADYEYRTRLPSPGFEALPEPQWHGDALKEERLVLVAERDLGDLINFARFAPMLASRGHDVTLLVPAAMKPLLSSLRGVKIATSEKELREDPRPLRWLPLMSVARVLGIRPDNVPADAPYLSAEPDRVARWAERLAGDGLKIGINWAGGEIDARRDSRRDIPLLKFAGLAALPGVQIISLQRGPAASELDHVPFRDQVKTFDLDPNPDAGLFRDIAAVMTQLDLIVTCDGPVAHLAGALGGPTFVPLPIIADWRWLLGRNDTPWYPSLRLFRQDEFHQWSEPFLRIVAEAGRMQSAR